MRRLYRWYVLAVLILIYMVNQVDRQIVTILAPYLKHDLSLTDAQLGLLYGTAFALFYGVLGIPLAKLADAWHRVRTLWLGLLFWSGMTGLSGFATNFPSLGVARIGVGIGEASASPAAISLLGDYFERRMRATILSLYFVGSYLGIGVSLVVGGAIIAAWQAAYPDFAAAPLHLRSWQAAFIGVGLPGIVLALLVATTIREPETGALEGIPQQRVKKPLRAVFEDIGSMIPPWSFLHLANKGRKNDLLVNIAGALAVVMLVAVVVSATDGLLRPERRAVIATLGAFSITTNVVQWTAIGIAVYAVGSWLQSVRLSDPVTYRLTAGSGTFRALVWASGFLGTLQNSLFAFVFLYGSRKFAFGAQSGVLLGSIAAAAGALGATAGGFAGDWAKRQHPAGRVYVSMAALTLVCISSIVQYMTGHVLTFYVAYTVASLFTTVWVGCLQATAQDLVLPRMRGIAFGLKSLSAAVIGLGLGPYLVGLISDVTGNLQVAILSSLLSAPCALTCLFYVARHLYRDEATVMQRATSAGEPNLPAQALDAPGEDLEPVPMERDIRRL